MDFSALTAVRWILDNKKNDSQTVDRREFALPTQIAFCLAIGLFSFISALNPLGIAGLPLSIIAAAMNTLLALGYSKSHGRLAILLAVNLIPFSAAAILMQSVVHALAALYPLVLALPIFLTVRMEQGRTASIMAAALCSTLLWLGYFALAIQAVYGACTPETIGLMLDESLAPIREMLGRLTYEYKGETVAYYGAEEIELLMYQVKTMLIGSIVSIMIVISYFVTLAARLIANVFDVTALLPSGIRICMRAHMEEDGPKVEFMQERVMWRIEIDSVTAILFIVAYIASFIFAFMGDSSLIPYSAAQNLIIILAPAFIYCGARESVLSFRGRASFGHINRFTLIFAVILMFVNPASIVTLISALGVIVTLRENRMKRDRDKIINGKE